MSTSLLSSCFSTCFSTCTVKKLTTATAVAALMALAAPLPALSQAAPATAPAPEAAAAAAAPASSTGQDFPADAQALSASELDARLRGKTYTAKLASGLGWRGQYKDSGYIFVNISSGLNDSGKWRTEDGKVCVEYRGRLTSGCSEVRAVGTALHAKNATTGVITVLQPD